MKRLDLPAKLDTLRKQLDDFSAKPAAPTPARVGLLLCDVLLTALESESLGLRSIPAPHAEEKHSRSGRYQAEQDV